MAKGILYVMTTVVSGLIKIGRTQTDNFESRMYNLEHNGYANVTGLHRRFAIEVEDYVDKEKLLDNIFSKSKVENTELFAIDEDIVVQLLSSFEGNVIFPPSEDKKTVFEQATAEVDKDRVKSTKQQPFCFSMVNIPIGTELEFANDPSIKVFVADDKHVKYHEKIYSMTTLTKILTGNSKPVQGPRYFKYRGKRLTDIRKDLEKSKTDSYFEH